MPRVFRHYVPMSILLLGGAEAAIVFASVYVGLALPFFGITEISPAKIQAAPMAVMLSLLVLAMAHICGLYDSKNRYGQRELFLRLAIAFLGAYLVLATLGFFVTPWYLSRKAYVLSFVVAFPLTLALRLGYERFTADSRHRRKVLLLGSGRGSQMIADTVNGAHQAWELIGCVDGHPDRVGATLNGVRILGAVDELERIAKATRPDVIVVGMKDRRGTLPIPEIIDCKFQGIEVEDWPNFYEKLTGKIPLSELRPSWLIFSDGFRKGRLTLAMKRALDLSLASVGSLLSLPLVPLIVVGIKLDSRGPVLFRQERMGQNGRVFTLLKFRTMRVNAEQETGAVWATERDPRITRVGRILRKTRLDELPQLWNVLAGAMSLVGPRPERPVFVAHLQEQIPFYSHRHAVRPGITGWAQVKYRYGACVEDAWEKLQYDLYYVKNASLFLDLLILLHTVQVVLFTRGAR